MSKKIVFAALGAFAAMTLAGSAAAGTSVAIQLTGTISGVCTVTSDTTSATLNLDTPGDQRVAMLTYTCNAPNGLTRRISSLNNGALKNGTASIPYLVSHTFAQNSGGGSLNFADTTLTGTLTTSVGGSLDLVRGLRGYFNANIPTLPTNLYAGTYTDTVTIDVSAN